jgi:hypothetical protein
MSAKDDPKPVSALKRRILAAIAAGPACLVAATVVSAPAIAQAAPRPEQDNADKVAPDTTIPGDHTQLHQWWGNGWRHPWGNWNNWHNWPNWNNWHNWANW